MIDTVRVYAADGVAIAAGSDGSIAARQVARICEGWRLRPVSEPLVVRNGLTQTKANILRPKSLQDEQSTCEPPDSNARCVELGGMVAASILLAHDNS